MDDDISNLITVVMYFMRLCEDQQKQLGQVLGENVDLKEELRFQIKRSSEEN